MPSASTKLLQFKGACFPQKQINSVIGSEPLVRGFALGYRFLILCASHKPPRCRERGVPRVRKAEGMCV